MNGCGEGAWGDPRGHQASSETQCACPEPHPSCPCLTPPGLGCGAGTGWCSSTRPRAAGLRWPESPPRQPVPDVPSLPTRSYVRPAVVGSTASGESPGPAGVGCGQSGRDQPGVPLTSHRPPQNGRSVSKRGVSCQFGPDVTKAFLEENQLDYIIRSHEVKAEGYEVAHGGRCVTVFSAPNYWCVSTFPAMVPPRPQVFVCSLALTFYDGRFLLWEG